MYHAADQMAATNPFSVARRSVSVLINTEKRFQGVESLHSALQTASSLVCMTFLDFNVEMLSNNSCRSRRGDSCILGVLVRNLDRNP